MVVPTGQLFLLILIGIKIATAECDGCAYTNFDKAFNTRESAPRKHLITSEDAPPGTLLCEFLVDENDPITLTDDGSPSITDYVQLSTKCQEVGDTILQKLSLRTVTSLDDFADTMENPAFFGSINSGSLSRKMTLQVTPVNDHKPQFDCSNYVLKEVPENFVKGYDLLSFYKVSVTAYDGDTPGDSSSRMHFSIINGDKDGTFAVSKTSSCSNSCKMQLMINGNIDYKTHPQYNLKLQVQDEGTPTSLSSTATLTITVQDVDDLNPKFDHTFYYANVTALNVGPYDLATTPAPIHAFDQDTGINAPIVYSLVVDNCGTSCDAVRAAFSMDENTGVITFNSDVDVAAIGRVASFLVQATQADNIDRSTLASVAVYFPYQCGS